MKNRVGRYLRGWSFMRLIRLVLGGVILTQGIIAAESLSVFLGGAFAGMALVNIGCNGSCSVNPIGTNNKNGPEFKEVGIKK